MKAELTGIERVSRIILAALVGILIWASAIDEKDFPVEYEIPLAVHLPEGYVLLGASTDSVVMRFTGTGWNMLSFQLGSSPDGITREYRPEAGGKLPLSAELELSAVSMQPGGRVELSQVLPSQITITVDTLISRRVPTVPVFSDGIPERFRFYRIEPEFITVTGPASLVNLMDSLRTESVFPGSEPVAASLAFTDEMVAYSEDSVRVSVFVPKVPTGSRIIGPGAY